VYGLVIKSTMPMFWSHFLLTSFVIMFELFFLVIFIRLKNVSRERKRELGTTCTLAVKISSWRSFLVILYCIMLSFIIFSLIMKQNDCNLY
jgi:hypothetical protein